MSELMRLYNTYLGPASDTLLDLGSPAFRWNNLYLVGAHTSNTITTNSVNTVVFIALGSSAQVGIVASGLNVTSAMIAGFASTGTTVNSLNVIAEACSNLILSNSAKAYINVQMLTHNVAGPVSGDVWFFASSNQLYLAARSQGATYYVAMVT